MLRPEKMSLLEISIHKSRIPQFLIEVPKHKIHIKLFEESEKKTPHHLRREHFLTESTALDEIKQKISEIEDNIIFYFQNFQLEPEKIEKPKKELRHKMVISSMVDGINQLHEQIAPEIRHLKGFIKDIEVTQEEIRNDEILREILIWLSEYDTTSVSLDWFNQLEFRVFYSTPGEFTDMEVNLEYEEIPLVIEFKEFDDNFTFFFTIFHHSYHQKISEICHNATEITNFEVYFNESGLNLILLDEVIKFRNERIEKNKILIDSEKNKAPKFRGYMELLQSFKKYDLLEKQFRETYRGDIIRLKAFIPTENKEEITTALIERFEGEIRIVSHIMEDQPKEKSKSNLKSIHGTHSEEYEYEEEEGIKAKLIVPSLIKPNKIFKPFTILTKLYGVSNYSELDPTPIVAITYPLLFGLMFGDIGQGLVLILIGVLMAVMNLKNKKNSMYDAGFLFIWLGLAACLGGLLYGSFFGVEGLFTPLFVNPMHNITTVLKMSIFVGVVHICIGWFLAMINDIHNGKVFLAFAEPFLKILMLIGGAIVIFTYNFDITKWLSPNSSIPYPILLSIIPAIFLLISKPIGRIFGIKYLKNESVGGLLGEQAVDVGETFLSILSNVASYSRLLALAMAHMGLMLVVMKIVEMFDSVIAIGVIVVFGNLFVILLEGMLAGIHALRLTFYEFFGKFYLADGIPYKYTEISSDYSLIEFGKK
nr:V-type ATPase 116kDa subunit family protein [Candidatus Prometheoarchaeum syntrophicum]QEE15866.1 V-type ATP synthase subunit I [Candidatus Prometheoarchaeum syntrophicum]